MTKTLILLLIAGMFAGCAGKNRQSNDFYLPSSEGTAQKRPRKEPDPPESKLIGEDLAIEAAVRRFSRDVGGEVKGTVTGVFLSLSKNQLDPAPAYLARFAGVKPKIRPYSEARRTAQGLVDPETGAPAVVLNVDGVEWLDLYTVQVPATWRNGDQPQRQFQYRFAWEKGKWRVP